MLAKVKVSKSHFAGIFLLGSLVLPQQAYACSWWDLPCKFEEAIRAAEEEVARGVEMALRAAREAASIASQRVAEEAERLEREGSEIAASEAESLAKGAENAYSETSKFVVQEYNVVKKDVESVVTSIEAKLANKLFQKVVNDNAIIFSAVERFANANSEKDAQALNRLERDILSRNITTQTVSDLKTILSSIRIQIPNERAVASLPEPTRLGAWDYWNGAVGSTFEESNLRQHMRLASLTVPHIQTMQPQPLIYAQSTQPQVSRLMNYLRGRFRSVGVGIKYGAADGVGGTVTIGIVIGIDSGEVASFWAAEAVYGVDPGFVPAGRLGIRKIIFSPDPPPELSNGIVGISAGPINVSWTIKEGMSGWSGAIPTLGLPIGVPGTGSIVIHGGYQKADVFQPIPRRPGTLTDQVALNTAPSCNLTSAPFQLMTNMAITGASLPMISGGNITDGSIYLQGAWTPIANQFWKALPAGKWKGECTYYLRNEKFGRFLVNHGNLAYGMDYSEKGQWKFNSNKGISGGYRITSAFDGRKIHTSYNGDGSTYSGRPRLVWLNEGAEIDSMWIVNDPSPHLPVPTTPRVTDTLQSGGILNGGERLVSQNGQYVAEFQNDGNFVVYGPSGFMWSSNTAGQNALGISMQADGNLIMYAPGMRPVWGTGRKPNGSTLQMQSDGNLVIRAPDGSFQWGTK